MAGFTIRCREDGPLVIEPPVEVLDHHGDPFPLPVDKPKLALCRCGQSGNRPFCDGTHKRIGFRAGETAAEGKEPSP